METPRHPQSTGINYSKSNSNTRDQYWKLVNIPPSETFIPGSYAWLEKKTSINGASTAYWIGADVSGISSLGDYTYETKFDYPDVAGSICETSLSFGYAADDYVKEIKLNGEKVYSCTSQCSTEYSKLHKMTINGLIQGSNNILQFTVCNGGTKSNPTGFLFQYSNMIVSSNTCKQIKSQNMLTDLLQGKYDVTLTDVKQIIMENQASFIGCLFAALYLLIVLISSKSKKTANGDKPTDKSSSSSSVVFALRDYVKSTDTTQQTETQITSGEIVATAAITPSAISNTATTAATLLEVQKKVEAEKVKAKAAEMHARKVADKTLKTTPLTIETITEFNAIAAAANNNNNNNNSNSKSAIISSTSTTTNTVNATTINETADGNATPTPFLDSFVRRLRQPGFQVERIKKDTRKDQLLHLNSKGELVWSKSMFSKTQPIVALVSVFEADDGFIMEFKNKKIVQLNMKESEFPFNAAAMITYFTAVIKKIESNPNYVDTICHHPGMKDYDSDDHDAASVNSDFTGATRSRANSTSANNNTTGNTTTTTTSDAATAAVGSNKIQAARRPSFGSLRLPSFKMSSSTSTTTATATTSKIDGIATNEDATTIVSSATAGVYTVVGGNTDGISQLQPPSPAASAAPTTLISMIRRPSFGNLRRPSLKSSASTGGTTTTTSASDATA